MRSHNGFAGAHRRRGASLAWAAAVLLLVGLAGPAAAADAPAHVVDAAAIQAQLDAHSDRVATDRAAVQALLQRPDVRRVAASAGLDVERARAAVAALSDAEISELADHARAVDTGLVGGDSRVVISGTGLLIIILLILLID